MVTSYHTPWIQLSVVCPLTDRISGVTEQLPQALVQDDVHYGHGVAL